MAIARLWRRSRVLAVVTGGLVLFAVALAILAATGALGPSWGLAMLDGAAVGAVIGILLTVSVLERDS